MASIPLAAALHRRPLALPSVSEVRDGFDRHELLTRASAIAFQALFALVPFLLFALALGGLVSLDTTWSRDIAPDLRPNVSPAVFTVLDDTVRNVAGHKRVFWVTGGLALTVWELSGAVRGIMDSLDSIYGARRRRSLRERLWTSAWLGTAIGACLLAAIVAVRFGPLLVGGAGPVAGVAVAIVRYLVAAGLLVLGVGLLLHHAPTARQPLGWISLGSGAIVVAWLVTWSLYAVYLADIASYGSIFGAFALVIVLLTFLYMSSIVLLAGALVDALVRSRSDRGAAA
jgi:membrane protein